MSENYLKKPFYYKIKKICRYIFMYGLMTTIIKMRGQLHMNQAKLPVKKQEWNNPKVTNGKILKRNIAIIGCGNFAYTTIARYCASQEPKFLHSVFDIDFQRALSLCKTYNGVQVVASADDIANNASIDTVFIASNHASHAEYAVQMIESGKSVHIEKPHVVNNTQLIRLMEAMKNNPDSRVYLGFNRPQSPLYHFIVKYLAQQKGSMMINWFIAGHEIADDHWYFSKEEGGRILGNLCHWTDITLRLVGLSNAFPVEVIPGSRPETKSDFAINYRFADGSLAVITFSAKGHSFEGVKEWLSLHKGDAIIRMADFQSAELDIGDKKIRKRLLFRDHGHRNNILNSLNAGDSIGVEDVEATALLFLATKEAVESGKKITINLNTSTSKV